MSGVFTLMNTLLIFFENAMSILLTNSLFSRRIFGWKYRLLVGAFILINPLAIYFLGENVFVKTAIIVLILIAWTKISFRVELAKCALEAVLFMSYLLVTDNLFLMCSAYLADGGLDGIQGSPYIYYLLCFIVKIIEFFGIILLCAWIRSHLKVEYSSWIDWFRTLFFPFVSLLLSIVLLQMLYIEPDLAPALIVCTLILLFADVMSIFLLNYIEEHRLAIRDNTILRQNLKKEEDGIAAWMDAYKDQRKQSHDFQNQLSVLRGMIENNVPRKDFIQYLDRLLNVELPTTLYIDTHRPVADVILSQKAAIARSKNIEFSTQLDDLSIFPLPDDALVVVLSNLLDNAINAADATPKVKRRYIVLKMRLGQEGGYLYVENSTGEPVKIIENRVVNYKSDSLEHGYGLQNIATMLARHNAIYAIDYRESDGAFCFSTQIFTDV